MAWNSKARATIAGNKAASGAASRGLSEKGQKTARTKAINKASAAENLKAKAAARKARRK